jgi:putative protein-disulfide isomerase
MDAFPAKSLTCAMTELIYFSDPMCSWCYGFSTVLRRLQQEWGKDLHISFILGGLRPWEKDAMSQEMKEMVKHHWHQVASRTGQPFDYGFFNRQGFVYDTEPSCRAVVTVRELFPGAEADFLGRVQSAFYAQNRDTTDAHILADLAEEAGLDRAKFEEAFRSEEMRLATEGDFSVTQQLGIRGFPTTVLQHEEQLKLLAPGFMGFEDLNARLKVLIGTPI